jgi:hypothetical protein
MYRGEDRQQHFPTLRIGRAPRWPLAGLSTPVFASPKSIQPVSQLAAQPFPARGFGVHDSFDRRDNILGGTKYLKMLLDRFQATSI